MPNSHRILVVDDEWAIADVLSHGLTRHGYATDAVYDPRQALTLMSQKRYTLVLCDVIMPRMNGMQLLAAIREGHPDTAVVMLTAVGEPDMIVGAMKLGALDYIVKPYSLDRVLVSVAAALEKRDAAIDIRTYHDQLIEDVKLGTNSLRQKNSEMQKLLVNIIQSLTFAIEAKDKFTEGHSRKVARYAAMIAKELAFGEQDQKQIVFAGLLHDIGKLAVRESVLAKPGPLTFDEYLHVKEHPLTAERILQPIRQLSSLIPSVKHHHEWYNGRGYPLGLAKDGIPLGARVLAVADAYDAMTSGRPYRAKSPSCEAFDELAHMAGEQFDPQVVAAFTGAMQHANWAN